MMRIEYSAEYKAEMELYAKEREAKKRAGEHALMRAREHWRATGKGWLPMSECPLGALEETHGIDGVIMVSDGREAALVAVSKRFGRPVFWKKAPEMVMRDGMMCLEGGEEDPRDDLPKWWWEYELKDQLETTYEHGETYHGAPIDFMPKKWTFLPEPPD